MASSSTPSRPSGPYNYEVFLSFRGEDTRLNFVSHLYTALSNRGIHTYKDDQTLPRGESITPSLEKAIEESRIALVVFSENYASSGWCLDELVKIIKCRDERGQIVMPVFYHVDPSDVRKQKGKFGDAFSKQKAVRGHRDADGCRGCLPVCLVFTSSQEIQEGNGSSKAESWKKALTDAASISGWEVKKVDDRDESKHIEDIFKAISIKLRPIRSRVSRNLIGMEIRMKKFIQLLKLGSDDVHMVGIWGLGGGGKTTLAFSVYEEVSLEFDGCSFVGNVREETNKFGLTKLQNQMLSDILIGKAEVGSVEEGECMIANRLCNKKVLIVLDDVDSSEQLRWLVGSKSWLGAGSRIIITTRNEGMLTDHNVREIYKINLLNNEEATELFNKHAFDALDARAPSDELKNLSRDVVSYACGLPLTLRILGSSLYNKDVQEWRTTLAKLRHIPHEETVDKLKISYDGLHLNEKEIFLDIACFFRGCRVSYVKKRLDACSFDTDTGIKRLLQKGLITIMEGDRLGMHDLVQELGQSIVQRDYPKNPKKHSRVWKSEDFQMICSPNVLTINESIEALVVKLPWGSNFRVFPKIKKLRLLDIEDWHNLFSEPPQYLSNELQWISWRAYPKSSQLPKEFDASNLSVLKLHWSGLSELWTGYKHLPCLKELDLFRSEWLTSTPDFNGLPLLEILDLSHCFRLTTIHSSIGYHEKLVEVDLSNCPSLKEFPPIILLKSLKVLHIHSSPSLANYGFKSHMFLSLSSLQNLNLWDCGLVDEDIPSYFGELSNLQILRFGGNKFSRIGSILSLLPRLKYLDLSFSSSLVELPDLPSSIAILEAHYCPLLEISADLPTNYKWLWYVSFIGCPKLHPDVRKVLQSMFQGNAIENDHYFYLAFHGYMLPRGFDPLMIEWNNFTLTLPMNWYNDFSGFLFGFILPDDDDGDGDGRGAIPTIRMHYVPFSALEHTTWWTSTRNMSSFFFKCEYPFLDNNFGFKLVHRKNKTINDQTQTAKTDFFDVGADFNIDRGMELEGVIDSLEDCVIDSVAGIKISFECYDLYIQ